MASKPAPQVCVFANFKSDRKDGEQVKEKQENRKDVAEAAGQWRVEE